MLNNDILEQIIEPTEHAVSVYLPLNPEQRDIRMQEARLREALRGIEQKLERRGLSEERRAPLLAPFREAFAGLDIAQHREPALAMFLGAEGLRSIPLPVEVPFRVTAGQYADIRPLLPILAQHRRFWLLAFSTGRTRLFAVTPFSCDEVPLALEKSASEMVEPDSGAERDEGFAAAALSDEIQRVEKAVKARIGTDPAPLLLAAEPRVNGYFRKLAALPQLQAEGLQLNPHAFSPMELKKRALEIMRPALESECRGVLEQIDARLGTAESTVAIRLEEIMTAAAEGRVDAVVVADDENLWGRFLPGEGLVHAHGSPSGEDEDLLNQTAIMALRNGGRAFALPRAQIPRTAAAAALFRF